MSENISRRRFLELSGAVAVGYLLSGCDYIAFKASDGEKKTAALPSSISTETPLPPPTSTPEPTKTLTPTPQPSSTQADTVTPTSTELPPITEGGKEILKKVVENCPGPVRYEGSYKGIKIPVTFSTDESYGNVVVKLANPANANRLAEMAADLFFRAGYEDTHPEMSLEDFMTGWKDGTIDRVTIPANRPGNPKYHAEPAEMLLTGHGLHIVFVDQNNYRFKDKMFEWYDGAASAGVHLSDSEIVLLAGIDSNHILFARSDIDPYGPTQDIAIAMAMALDHDSIKDPHCKWIWNGAISVIRATKCPQ